MYEYTALSLILLQLQQVTNLRVKDFLIFKMYSVKGNPAEKRLLSLEGNANTHQQK
jgi:hypothetical protein